MHDDKAQIGSFCTLVVRHMFRDDSNSEILRQFEEIEWEDWPLRGVKEALSDVLEWSQDVTGEELSQLDDKLHDAGLPSLSQIRTEWKIAT